MAVQHDPLVRTEIVALALGRGMNCARLYAKKGILPPLELQKPAFPPTARAWHLSTLQKHNPELGRRCAALLAVAALMPPLKMKTVPLKAA